MTSRVPGDRPTAVEVADAARDIERGLYAPTNGDVDATQALDATRALDATQALGPTEALAPTRALDEAEPQPTRVLPAGAAVTERLPARSSGSPQPDRGTPADHPARAPRRLPRRVYAALAGIVVIVAAIVFGLAALPGETPESSDQPTFAENGGDLGTHLDQLLESVTP